MVVIWFPQKGNESNCVVAFFFALPKGSVALSVYAVLCRPDIDECTMQIPIYGGRVGFRARRKDVVKNVKKRCERLKDGEVCLGYGRDDATSRE